MGLRCRLERIAIRPVQCQIAETIGILARIRHPIVIPTGVRRRAIIALLTYKAAEILGQIIGPTTLILNIKRLGVMGKHDTLVRLNKVLQSLKRIRI
ncbi:hypothetical protein SDC9_199819 [bioreactor metagenome]|uniref:Uncharacterized protein n=1 Tax=bioreactor metagenome TaxID=1076179 RepID=A0A645ILH1_9ZZZZ